MRKLTSMMRVLALVFFCAAIFAVSYGALVLKKHNPFQRGDAKEEGASGAEKGAGPAEGKDGATTVRASLEGEPASPESPTGKAEADPESREKALTSGRALFTVPGPYSIPQISALMDELEHARSDYKQRATSLDLRERQLDAFSHELEQKRIEVLNLAKTITPPPQAAGVKSEVLDAKTVASLAKIFANMQPQAAANALNGYTADRSAQILMAMKDEKIGEILSQMGSDGLKRITDAIARVNSANNEESGN